MSLMLSWPVTANSLLVPAAPAATPSLSRSHGGATEAHLSPSLSVNRLSTQGFPLSGDFDTIYTPLLKVSKPLEATTARPLKGQGL